MIDLRSDTVTKPSKGMLEAMMAAEVGDDIFNEDPTVIALEQKAADLLGKEAGLFCPSGTMTNQIALRLHTQPGDEVICHRYAHIYNYEGGGPAVNSGISVRLVDGDKGIFTAADVAANVNPDDIHFPVTRVVSIENTCNKGGGSYWTLQQMQDIRQECDRHGLALHLDGARLFNALAATGDSTADVGALFDTVSLCLSKGLGAPVGSVLLGTTEGMKRAKRIRKVLGGGMRQAGILAAAGIYALDNNVDRLAEDHRLAQQLGTAISTMPFVKNTVPVETNIVIFTLNDDVPQEQFIQTLLQNGIKVVPFGPQTIRMVTHMDFNAAMLEELTTKLGSLF